MIPAARGLGSSAAAIVAGLLLGAAAGRHAPDADELFTLAATLEGHPDNVAAALYGGITLAVAGEVGTTPLLRRFRVPEAWIPVLFIASATSRTQGMRDGPAGDACPITRRPPRRHARRCWRPRSSPRTPALLRTAMDDRLHQPYRLPLLPGSAELIETAYEHGAAGAALSGAGPSVLAICDSPDQRPLGREGLERGRRARHGDPPSLRHGRRSPEHAPNRSDEPRHPDRDRQEPRRPAPLRRRQPADHDGAADRDRRAERRRQDDAARDHHRRAGGGRRDGHPRQGPGDRLPAAGGGAGARAAASWPRCSPAPAR